jgi:BirA family biotin operon repressor/biotin-[acetyl-CoA-carboxylase] ligase
MTSYKLQIAEDEPLSVNAITCDLGTRLLARRVVYRECIESTNNLAKQLADAGEPEGTLVIAEEQTAGRGRLGRTWVAPSRSSILMSLILRPALVPHQTARVTMAVALGACDGIRAATRLDARIKWPNDILLRGHKCAGILAEAGITGDCLDYVVVGIGLNVNFAVIDHPDLPRDVTSIADELGKPTPRAPLVQAIVRGIEAYYLRLCAGENLRAEWATRMLTLNQRVRAQTPWGDEEGIAEDVDEDGALLLRRNDDSVVRLIAGDVTLVRR